MMLDRTLARAALFGAKAQTALAAPAPAWLRASAQDERYKLPDPGKIENQVSLYTKLSWIQIAVSIGSQTAAAAAFEVKRGGSDNATAIDNHPFVVGAPGLYGSLARPNPMMSRFEFLEATFSWRKTTGNCYWFLNRPNENAIPLEMWIVPSHQIQPVPDEQSYIKGYLYDTGGGHAPIPLEPWEIMHFKLWNPHSRYLGLSPLQALMYDAVGDIASQVYNANFYGRDNAKAAGILAFSDPIDDGRWERLKVDMAEQHGGTKQNRIMRLRNVGPGGVQWITTQLSQVEIQYLEQRNFTKEEIFEMFAPGLSSMLAVNSTEANSVSGKDTFLSMAIYPQHIAVAEKIDNDLLPVYGDDLTGAFEDVRRVDTAVELQEQAEFSKTHTINEIRKKYYGDKDLDDDRGNLLPAEVGKGMTDARAPEDKPPPPSPFGIPGQGGAPNAEQAGTDGATGEVPVTQNSKPITQNSAKAKDRRRWYEKATNALARGGVCDVPFDPEYLSDSEAMTIRAALKRAASADDVWRAVEEG
jgi:HK97 family phage portal protein